MKGRLRIAVVMMVCLVAIVALPAAAHAVSFQSTFPAGTVYGQPSVVSVDVFGGVDPSTAVITINGVAQPTFATASTNGGSWALTQTNTGNGYYVSTWLWVSGTAGAKTTLYCYPGALLAGSVNVTATVNDTTAPTPVLQTQPWSFTLVANGTAPTPPASVATTQTCVACHSATSTTPEVIASGTNQNYAIDNAMGPLCGSCHTGAYGPHGFNMGSASGHNTTLVGKIGAKTEFDGANGSTAIQWTSRATSSTFVVPTTQAGGSVTGITTGTVGTLGTQWQFPTVNVFWSTSATNAPVGAIKGLTASSVVACEDCHTGLNAVGPHGAAQYWGIDPAYPSQYSYARLTKWIVTNPAGIGVYSVLDTISVSATSGLITADTQHPGNVGGVAQYSGGSASDMSHAVICAKCHDLENFNSGTTTSATLDWLLANGSATSTVTGAINTSAVGASNTAHSSHHQDTGTMNVDGSPQCVNCHIGIPHGWKRPRLLVDTDQDAAPYRSVNQLGTTQGGSSGIMNTGSTIGAGNITPGWAAHLGFNGQGMQSLSAVDQHTLVNGAAQWTEAGCEACGFHSGQDNNLPSNKGVRVN